MMKASIEDGRESDSDTSAPGEPSATNNTERATGPNDLVRDSSIHLMEGSGGCYLLVHSQCMDLVSCQAQSRLQILRSDDIGGIKANADFVELHLE